MLIAMIIWGVALWCLSKFVLRDPSTTPAAPRPEVLMPLGPLEPAAAAYPGEALEADLVFARLTGQLDVTAYQEAMAALAASTPSPLPDVGRHGR